MLFFEVEIRQEGSKAAAGIALLPSLAALFQKAGALDQSGSDREENRYVDCSKEPLRFSELFINDIINRTETAITQEKVFLAAELGLSAQAKAKELRLKG